MNKANVTARLKEIKGDKEAKDEAAVLNDWLKLNTEEADLKKRLKDAEAALDAKAYAQYPKLTEAEIKTLVVDDKWLAALDAAIHGEMDRVSQQLTQRVKELAERYETPLPQMVSRVAELEAKVNQPPGKDGFLMEVKPGFKQTEVGVIPEDWEWSIPLGLVATYDGDGRTSNPSATFENTSIVTSKFISTHGDVTKDIQIVECFSGCQKGDILMVMSDVSNGRRGHCEDAFL